MLGRTTVLASEINPLVVNRWIGSGVRIRRGSIDAALTSRRRYGCLEYAFDLLLRGILNPILKQRQRDESEVISCPLTHIKNFVAREVIHLLKRQIDRDLCHFPSIILLAAAAVIAMILTRFSTQGEL
jgi:hypothetical protein